MNSHTILIDDVGLMPEGEEKIRATVKLRLESHLGYGEEIGTNSSEETLKLVALATIKAINSLLPRPIDLKFDYIKTSTSSSNTPLIKTLVCLRKPDKNIFLNGSSPISDDHNKAVVNAILNALEKIIEGELNTNKFRKKINTDSQDITELFVNLAQTDHSLNASEFQQDTSINSANSDSLDTSLNTSRAKNFASQAKTAYMKGNHKQAVFYYKQAINFNPFDPSYYYQLGLVLGNLPDQNKEIEIVLLKAIELNPKEVSYHLELGFLYKKISLIEKALQQFKEVLVIDSTSEIAKQLVQELNKEQLELSLAPFNKSVLASNKKKPDEKSKGILSLNVSSRILGISLVVAIGFVGLSLAILYVINLPSLNHKTTTFQKNKEQMKALELVQNYSSVVSGLTIKEHLATIISKEKVTSFEWSVGQEKSKKTSKEYLVIFFFQQNNKNQYAIWSVDAKEWKVKCKNTMAESFTKL